MNLRNLSLLSFAIPVVALTAVVGCDVERRDAPSEPDTAAGGKSDVIEVAPCEADSDCADDEVCEPGLCFFWCHVDDPECCEPSSCVPMEPEPENECQTDLDCGDEQWCAPGVCLTHCLPTDPGCCAPNRCEPIPEPEPEPEPEPNECEQDADCGDDQFCMPGVCLFWCAVGDPSCCAPNTCQDV